MPHVQEPQSYRKGIFKFIAWHDQFLPKARLAYPRHVEKKQKASCMAKLPWLTFLGHHIHASTGRAQGGSQKSLIKSG
jgi:hypothetical protein